MDWDRNEIVDPDFDTVTYFEDDLYEWETEQVFQDHEGWD